ncbi:MAG TPA: hypothetical protein VHE35_16985 [Kofleriaceae bacterium]|nr:hypothetical protein [Kofleriaceae bacterium]
MRIPALPGWPPRAAALAVAVALSPAALTACGDDENVPPLVDARIDAAAIDAPAIDAAVDAPVDAAAFVEPTMLSETGLYADIAAKTIAPGVVAFTPRWPLWSDDADKHRWIQLPPGSHIDTSSMDHWSFPTGTKVWKEFVRGGRRVETRLLEKIGPTDDADDWFMMSFAWDAGEHDAVAAPDGVDDPVGHDDIPAQAACKACHRNTRVPSVIIGFSALQLDTAPAIAGQPSLATLVADGRLSDPPAGTMPYFPLPAGDPLAAAAFGYMHANCGNCHNPQSDVVDAVPVVLRLPVGELASWATTPTYLTTVDRPLGAGAPGATAVVEPGVPDTSALYLRVTSTGSIRMPPLGREVVDPTGSEAIRAWIASLPPTP